MTTVSSDNVFVDASYGDCSELSYYPRARNTSTLGSGGSSNGGLEVFIERDEERVEEEAGVDDGQTNYRSNSLSPQKMSGDREVHIISEEADSISKCITNEVQSILAVSMLTM